MVELERIGSEGAGRPGLALIQAALLQVDALKRRALKRAMTRILNACFALWSANQWLSNEYGLVKQENAGLYHFLAATIIRNGELRFSKEELEGTIWGKRIRGYCVPGSTDVVFRVSEEAVLLDDAPPWLSDAIEGLPVPELTVTTPLFQAVFDPTDLYAQPALSEPNDG